MAVLVLARALVVVTAQALPVKRRHEKIRGVAPASRSPGFDEIEGDRIGG